MLAELLTASISCRRQAPESENTCLSSYRRLCAYPLPDACRILGRGRERFTPSAVLEENPTRLKDWFTTSIRRNQEAVVTTSGFALSMPLLNLHRLPLLGERVSKHEAAYLFGKAWLQTT